MTTAAGRPVERKGPAGDEPLARFLQAAGAAALGLAAAGVLLPGPAGRVAAWAMLAVLVAAPFLRVAWLAARWARPPDWRFFGAAVALLALTAVGAVLAAVT